MALSFLLPDAPLYPDQAQTFMAQLHFHFGPDLRVKFLARPETLSAWADSVPEVEPWGEMPSLDCEALVCFRKAGAEALPAPLVAWSHALPLWGLNEYGQCLRWEGGTWKAPDPEGQSHVFNRLGPEFGPFGSYFHFPYGYLYRYPGMGPLNPFGHRIEGPFRHLAQRGADHKLVAVFGGSAAWDMFALPSETFCSKLEAQLNRFGQALAHPLRFTVLNFAQHGNVVLNEMLTYLMLVDDLHPEVVLAHDGFNDLLYGSTTDPKLLADWDITYQNNLEAWSQLLHGTRGKVTTQGAEFPYQPVNLPQAIIGAFLRRKLQFHDLVTARGGQFVWATQPFMQSKQALSPEELVAQRSGVGAAAAFKVIFSKMPFLYDQLQKVQLPERVRLVLDFHREFSAFGADRTLFCDVVHQNALANGFIAERYLACIRGIFEGGARG